MVHIANPGSLPLRPARIHGVGEAVVKGRRRVGAAGGIVPFVEHRQYLRSEMIAAHAISRLASVQTTQEHRKAVSVPVPFLDTLLLRRRDRQPLPLLVRQQRLCLRGSPHPEPPRILGRPRRDDRAQAAEQADQDAQPASGHWRFSVCGVMLLRNKVLAWTASVRFMSSPRGSGDP